MRTLAIYHAGTYNAPLCGARGTANRWNVVVLPPREWNALAPAQRCSKCVAKIQARKAAARRAVTTTPGRALA